MTRRVRSAAVVAVFTVVAVLLTYTVWATLRRSVAGPTDGYAAVFSDVLGLRVGDDVRMAGVRVGRVDRIDFADGYRARVDFSLAAGQHLTDTTEAVVRYQNLIGQRYVALLPGAERGREIPAGSTIPLERTEPSFDVSALLSGFEPLFAVLQPDQVNALSQTLIDALQGNRVSMAAMITQAAQLADTFDQRDRILGDVVGNLGVVVGGLANRGHELDTLIAQSRTLMDGLYAQGESLKRSVDQVATSTGSLVGLISTLRPGLVGAQADATSGVALLIADGASMDRAAVELPGLLNGLARMTSYGAYGNAYICRLDVSLWGVLLPPGLFSQVGGDSQSEVCR